MEKCEPHNRNHSRGNMMKPRKNSCYGDFVEVPTEIVDYKYPKSVINFQPDHKMFFHPTEKPVPLLEWLIKTYTNEHETVLDNCMGSGSTGVACINTNRKFIGIEIDNEYFETAKRRVTESIYGMHIW